MQNWSRYDYKIKEFSYTKIHFYTINLRFRCVFRLMSSNVFNISYWHYTHCVKSVCMKVPFMLNQMHIKRRVLASDGVKKCMLRFEIIK